MKKIIINLAILTILISSSAAMASSYVIDTQSLVGIEASSSHMNVDNDDTPVFSDRKKFYGIGLKIGAETETYRVYLSARDNVTDNSDYIYTLGGELQYKINFSSLANIFLGVSAGYARIVFEDEAGITRKFSSKCYGGDIGFNLHPEKDVDLEFGMRMVSLKDSTHLQNNITYDFDNMTSTYISLIFKYVMD